MITQNKVKQIIRELFQTQKYYSSLDLLRGIASIVVVFFHLTNANEMYLSEDNIVKNIGAYGFLGVEIFFIISGFVIPFSMYSKGYKFSKFPEFISKRLIRLEPPYFISIIAVLILDYISTFSSTYIGNAFNTSFLGLIFHLGYINTFFDYRWLNPVYWSLAIEFQYYIFIALIYPLFISKNKWSNYLLFLILISLSFFETQGIIIQYFLFFSIGILTFKKQTDSIKIKEYLIILSLIYIAILIKYNFIFFIASLIPLIFIFFVKNVNIIGKFLGKISYSLYLVHFPLGMKLINVSDNYIQNENYRVLFIFFVLIICVFVAWLFYLLIEKKSIKWSQRIIY